MQEEITLKELLVKTNNVFRFLLSKWLLISVAALVGLSIGLALAMSKKPTYEGRISFSLDEEKSGGGAGLAGLAATFGFDVGGGGSLFTNENIIQLFSSRKIIDAALLTAMPGSGESHGDVLLNLTGIREKANLPARFLALGTDLNKLSRQQDSVLAMLHTLVTKKGIMVPAKPDKKVDIYTVTVKSADENFSRSFGKAVVDQAAKLYHEIKTRKAQQTVDILQRRVDSLRRANTRAIYGRAAEVDANLNPAFQSVTAGAMVKQAEVQVASTAYAELLKNLEMSKYSLLKQSPLFQIIDEPRQYLEKKQPSKLVYGLTGGFLAGFVTISVLLLRRFLASL